MYHELFIYYTSTGLVVIKIIASKNDNNYIIMTLKKDNKHFFTLSLSLYLSL